jgi:hypothetical protein
VIELMAQLDVCISCVKRVVANALAQAILLARSLLSCTVFFGVAAVNFLAHM